MTTTSVKSFILLRTKKAIKNFLLRLVQYNGYCCKREQFQIYNKYGREGREREEIQIKNLWENISLGRKSIIID